MRAAELFATTAKQLIGFPSQPPRVTTKRSSIWAACILRGWESPKMMRKPRVGFGWLQSRVSLRLSTIWQFSSFKDGVGLRIQGKQCAGFG